MVRLAPETLHPESVEAAVETLRSGHYTMGEKVAEFERAICQRTGATHAVMVNSGSSANLLAIEVLMRPSSPWRAKLKPGDHVLVPALAWSTTLFPLIQLGLVPVLVDIEPDTLMLSLAAAENALTPAARAMMLVQVLGHPIDTLRYVEWCEQHNLILIEDACESFGARDASRPSAAYVGRYGIVGTYSFFYSHPLSTIEGGMIVTDSGAIADDLRSARAHGWSRDRRDRASWLVGEDGWDDFLFVTTGYNVRPLDVEAAIGLSELQYFDQDQAERTTIAHRLIDLLITWPGVEVPRAFRDGGRNGVWMYVPARVNSTISPVTGQSASRDALVRYLRSIGVGCRPLLAGNLASHPACRSLAVTQPLPVCEALDRDAFMIGCAPGSDVDAVENALLTLSV